MDWAEAARSRDRPGRRNVPWHSQLLRPVLPLPRHWFERIVCPAARIGLRPYPVHVLRPPGGCNNQPARWHLWLQAIMKMRSRHSSRFMPVPTTYREGDLFVHGSALWPEGNIPLEPFLIRQC